MDPDQLLDVVDEHPDPVVSTREIADEIDLSRRRTLDLLSALETVGEIESKKIDGRARVWYRPRLRDRPDRRRDRPDLESSDDVDDDHEESADDLEQLVDELDLPGSGEILDQRREAVRQCIAILRRDGSAQKSDFIEEIYPENPAGYQSKNGFWNTIGKNGLAEIAERSDVIESPPEGSHSVPWQLNESNNS